MAGSRIAVHGVLEETSWKLLLLLLGALVMCYQAVGSSELHTSFTEACGDFLPGYSRKALINVFALQLVPYSPMTAEDCGVACTSDPLCDGFLYTNGSGCSLMAEVGSEGVPYDSGNSYVKCAAGQDANGDDPVAAALAKSTLAVVAGMQGQQVGGPGGPPGDAARVVLAGGVITPDKCGGQFPGFARVVGFDFWPAAHTDLDVLQQPISVEECAFACANLVQCKGWVYKPKGDGAPSRATGCFLKKSAAKLGKYVRSRGASYIACIDASKPLISPRKAVAAATTAPACGATVAGYRVYPNRNLWPRDGKHYPAALGKQLSPMVVSLCEGICLGKSACVGFVYHDGGVGKQGCQLVQAAAQGEALENSKFRSYVKC